MVELNHPEVNRLARELALYTGENITQAVVTALSERLAREQKKHPPQLLTLQDKLLRIAQECAALPLLDIRTPDEIVGYNEVGVPV